MDAYNEIQLVAYVSGSTPVTNSGLDDAEGLTFSSIDPGGRYAGMTFFIRRDVTGDWAVKEGQRIKAFNGLTCAWEGKVNSILASTRAGAEGFEVTCLGHWADIFMRRGILKPWADSRIDDSVWQEPSALFTAGDITGLKYCNVDRQNRIRFTPRSTRNAAGAETGWTSGQYHRVCYTVPTGQTIQRITFDYDLQTGAQSWQMRLYNGAVTSLWLTAITGTGSQDIALGANANQSVSMLFWSAANQTPPSDGTIYGEFSNIVVYTETGAINAQEITKDIRSYIPELSASDSNIDALTLDLSDGFVAEADMTYAGILEMALQYGDASNNLWAARVENSDYSTDDKPVLYLKQQPALTDYDIAVRLDEPNLQDTVSFERVIDDDFANWVTVTYQDETGRDITLTPADDATLKDQTSIDKVGGEYHKNLRIDTASETLAKNYAKTYLAAHKDVRWKASGNIVVKDYIRGKGGQIIPSSEIKAGMRLKFENFLDDLSGAGLTLTISSVEYNDATGEATISVGASDHIAAWLARELRKNR